MISRSGKIVRKRHRHSSADEIKEEEDIISKLPDALLTEILSYLPEADANRTRILSKRWKDIWAFLPNLRLVMPFDCSSEEANKFHDFVDQIIALRGGMNINRVSLSCSKNFDYNRVCDWLCTVVKCNVQEIELGFSAERFLVKFCWSLFKSCNTLVGLTLRGEFVLDVRQVELRFPCLKKLNLVSTVYSGDQSLTNLISGCPVLEELFVRRQVIGCSDNMKTFKVSSLSLKRLKISFTLGVLGNYHVVIDAPIEYIYIGNANSTYYTFTKPLSLVEAHMNTRRPINSNVLMNLNSAKILTLTNSTLMGLQELYAIQIPMFHNLVKFEIGVTYRFGWSLLPLFLGSMPNLEHITFLDGLVPFLCAQHAHTFNMLWNPPMYLPNCLRFKLKEIIIRNRQAITQQEFPLISYLLRYSYHLEKLSIIAHNINPMILWQLLRFPRGSDLILQEVKEGYVKRVDVFSYTTLELITRGA
ncbi:hypothetical protein L2E82_28366 [Cichorium intybus]|uniref:Uncharacterized protein n=1 Tax=Cichorium intybus TaxID=13427 RepID=A0ACB9CVJ7_CICIN|nr:hypothetical protein L2E82_28366 [Cichorium intybus]